MPTGNSDASHVSVVDLVQRGDPAERSKAVDHIVTAHWKPLYKYLRLQYQISHTVAWTVILNFLALFQERTFFAGFDPTKLPPREFIRQKLDVFVPTPGARKVVASWPALDFTGAEEEFKADQERPGQSALEYYNSEWVRNLLTLAVEELHSRLAAEGKNKDIALFMKLDLQDRSGDERVGTEAIASELSIPMDEAWNSLAQTRQQFQDILIDLIRSFTSSEAEFRREAQAFIRS